MRTRHAPSCTRTMGRAVRTVRRHATGSPRALAAIVHLASLAYTPRVTAAYKGAHAAQSQRMARINRLRHV